MPKLSTMAHHSIAELTAKKFLNVRIRKMLEHPFPASCTVQSTLAITSAIRPLSYDLLVSKVVLLMTMFNALANPSPLLSSCTPQFPKPDLA
jgi:hypothetical protein